MSTTPSISVVVPMYNEEESVVALVEAVREALDPVGAWELLVVDDGSTDDTALIAEELARAEPRLRVVRLARNYGQTPAMQAGFDLARGDVVVSMDGDLQNDPRDIPALLARLAEGFDLVAGYRVRRQDHMLTRLVPSWFANRLIRAVTGVRIRDNGCSLKAYRRELLDRIHLYSDMHRFIPAVAAATAGARISEIPVRHHPRLFGESKYGLSRIGKVVADLLVIKMIRSFRERPLVMFAGGALLSLSVAAIFSLPLLACGLAGFIPLMPGCARSIVIPSATMLWLGLGWYLLMLGLIAEALVRQTVPSRPGRLPVARERGVD
jgi:glycosyltransferase involved in cell wall biosynthesis